MQSRINFLETLVKDKELLKDQDSPSKESFDKSESIIDDCITI